MKMKLSTVIDTHNDIVGNNNGKLEKPLIAKNLPAKLSYAISKNVRTLEKEVLLFEKEKRRIFLEYCEKDDAGNPKVYESEGKSVNRIREGSNDAYIGEMNDLLETEVDIEVMYVRFEDIEKCESSDRYDAISAKDMIALDFMIK